MNIHYKVFTYTATSCFFSNTLF